VPTVQESLELIGMEYKHLQVEQLTQHHRKLLKLVLVKVEKLEFSEFGQLCRMQFVDLNAKLSAFQRHYSHDVKRAEELERRIRFLETVLAEQKFKLSKQELNEAVEMTELSTLELLEARVRQFAIFFFFFFFFSSGFFCFFCL
jgi:lysyl-tRNA synthetase class I